MAGELRAIRCVNMQLRLSIFQTIECIIHIYCYAILIRLLLARARCWSCRRVNRSRQQVQSRRRSERFLTLCLQLLADYEAHGFVLALNN